MEIEGQIFLDENFILFFGDQNFFNKICFFVCESELYKQTYLCRKED